MKNIKIGYWPNSKSLDAPGDRRRFIFYLENNNIDFEIFDPSKKYDLVYLSQSADISQVNEIKQTGAKIFYDNINSYSSEKISIRSILRGLGKYFSSSSKYLVLNYNKFLKESVLPKVDCVVCASEEQALIASKFSSNVFSIPDHTHNETVSVKENYLSKKVINIGWEGLGSNVYQLNLLKDVFYRFSKDYEFNLHVISDRYSYKYMNRFIKTDNKKILEGLCKNLIFHEWNKETYSSILIECDFAIIPIDLKNRMASGKPENKLVNLWKMGLPVITSNTKSYSRVMNDCGLNYYAKSEDQWLEYLKLFSQDNELREEIGLRVYNYANKNYGVSAVIKKWDKMFNLFFK